MESKEIAQNSSSNSKDNIFGWYVNLDEVSDFYESDSEFSESPFDEVAAERRHPFAVKKSEEEIYDFSSIILKPITSEESTKQGFRVELNPFFGFVSSSFFVFRFCSTLVKTTKTAIKKSGIPKVLNTLFPKKTRIPLFLTTLNFLLIERRNPTLPARIGC